MKESLELALNAINHDKDVKVARAEGELAGKECEDQGEDEKRSRPPDYTSSITRWPGFINAGAQTER